MKTIFTKVHYVKDIPQNRNRKQNRKTAKRQNPYIFARTIPQTEPITLEYLESVYRTIIFILIPNILRF